MSIWGFTTQAYPDGEDSLYYNPSKDFKSEEEWLEYWAEYNRMFDPYISKLNSDEWANKQVQLNKELYQGAVSGIPAADQFEQIYTPEEITNYQKDAFKNPDSARYMGWTVDSFAEYIKHQSKWDNITKDYQGNYLENDAIVREALKVDGNLANPEDSRYLLDLHKWKRREEHRNDPSPNLTYGLHRFEEVFRKMPLVVPHALQTVEAPGGLMPQFRAFFSDIGTVLNLPKYLDNKYNEEERDPAWQRLKSRWKLANKGSLPMMTTPGVLGVGMSMLNKQSDEYKELEAEYKNQWMEKYGPGSKSWQRSLANHKYYVDTMHAMRVNINEELARSVRDNPSLQATMELNREDPLSLRSFFKPRHWKRVAAEFAPSVTAMTAGGILGWGHKGAQAAISFGAMYGMEGSDAWWQAMDTLMTEHGYTADEAAPIASEVFKYAGGINAGLELLQMGRLARLLPGGTDKLGKSLIDKIIARSIQFAHRNAPKGVATVKLGAPTKVAINLSRFPVNMGEGGFIELMQAGTNIILDEAVKEGIGKDKEEAMRVLSAKVYDPSSWINYDTEEGKWGGALTQPEATQAFIMGMMGEAGMGGPARFTNAVQRSVQLRKEGINWGEAIKRATIGNDQWLAFKTGDWESPSTEPFTVPGTKQIETEADTGPIIPEAEDTVSPSSQISNIMNQAPTPSVGYGLTLISQNDPDSPLYGQSVNKILSGESTGDKELDKIISINRQLEANPHEKLINLLNHLNNKGKKTEVIQILNEVKNDPTLLNKIISDKRTRLAETINSQFKGDKKQKDLITKLDEMSDEDILATYEEGKQDKILKQAGIDLDAKLEEQKEKKLEQTLDKKVDPDISVDPDVIIMGEPGAPTPEQEAAIDALEQKEFEEQTGGAVPQEEPSVYKEALQNKYKESGTAGVQKTIIGTPKSRPSLTELNKIQKDIVPEDLRLEVNEKNRNQIANNIANIIHQENVGPTKQKPSLKKAKKPIKKEVIEKEEISLGPKEAEKKKAEILDEISNKPTLTVFRGTEGEVEGPVEIEVGDWSEKGKKDGKTYIIDPIVDHIENRKGSDDTTNIKKAKTIVVEGNQEKLILDMVRAKAKGAEDIDINDKDFFSKADKYIREYFIWPHSDVEYIVFTNEQQPQKPVEVLDVNTGRFWSTEKAEAEIYAGQQKARKKKREDLVTIPDTIEEPSHSMPRKEAELRLKELLKDESTLSGEEGAQDQALLNDEIRALEEALGKAPKPKFDSPEQEQALKIWFEAGQPPMKETKKLLNNLPSPNAINTERAFQEISEFAMLRGKPNQDNTWYDRVESYFKDKEEAPTAPEIKADTKGLNKKTKNEIDSIMDTIGDEDVAANDEVQGSTDNAIKDLDKDLC